MNSLFTPILAILFPAFLPAGTVTFTSQNTDLDATGLGSGTIGVGSVVLLGTYSTPPTPDSTYASSQSAFTQLGSTTTYNRSGKTYFSGTATTQEEVGKQLYVWVFNSPNINTATAQVLLTSPLWIVPTIQPTLDFVTLTIGSGYAVVGGLAFPNGKPVVKFHSLAPPIFNFNSDYGLSGSNSQPNADPDGDGLSNAVEFALGTSPTFATASNYRLTCTVEGSTQKLTYRRRYGGVPGVTYQIETATSLSGPWTIAIPSVDYTQTTAIYDGASERVSVTMTNPMSGASFFRLALTY